MNNKKNYLITATLFSMMSFLYAQNETQDAENQIKKATASLTAKNFIEASKDLQKAKEEVTKLISNQLTAGLPAKFENWVAVNDSKTGHSMGMPPMGIPPMGMGMAGGNDMMATKIYEIPQKNDGTKKDIPPPPIAKRDSLPGMELLPPMPPGGMNMPGMGMNNGVPRMIVTISNNVSIASVIASVNSGVPGSPMMGGPMGGAEESKAIKIKNYRASSKYNKIMKTGEVGVIVGAGVVQVQGTNIESSEVLQKFAEQIDYEKIKAVFGE